MADGIVINKADGDNIKRARDAKLEFNRALHLYPEKESQWKPKVQLCSGLHGEGISEVWEMISEYHKKVQENGFLKTGMNRINSGFSRRSMNI